MLTALEAIKASHPNNRAAKHFDRTYFDSLRPDDQAALLACVASGVANPSSSVGCYATRPSDYDELGGFFGPLIADYHGVPAGVAQRSDWTLPPRTDLAELGLGATSCRVRVGRNLAAYPLPAGMGERHRRSLEATMIAAFERLAARPMEDTGRPYGGRYCSLTPGLPETITEERYAALVADHLMFKSMADDPYLAAAGVSADWPIGRGAYQCTG